jgi:hypothetical protein
MRQHHEQHHETAPVRVRAQIVQNDDQRQRRMTRRARLRAKRAFVWGV